MDDSKEFFQQVDEETEKEKQERIEEQESQLARAVRKVLWKRLTSDTAIV